MERDLPALASEDFDVLVIGGGVLGGAVAWMAADRGLRTALVEARDFAAASSGNSLKIVHGGLRYLQNLDLPRARKSILERRFWLRVAPHLVEPRPFLVPLAGSGLERRTLVRVALGLNDLLSLDRNRGVVEDRRLPGGRVVDSGTATRRIPELSELSCDGAALFHDAVMYSPERLVLEMVRAAGHLGARTANHLEVTGPLEEGGRLHGAVAVDRLTGDELPIRARALVNATGASAVELERRLLREIPRRSQPRVAALNLVARSTGHEVAFSFRTRDGRSDLDRERSRHLLAVPWRGRTLVGTAYYRSGASGADELNPAAAGERFRSEVDDLLPALGLSRDAVLGVDLGLLPVTRTGNGGPLQLLDRPDLTIHGNGGDGAPLLTAVTEKFTTARALAERVVRKLFRLRGHDGLPEPASDGLLPGGTARPVHTLMSDARQEHPEIEGEVLEHLVRTYGRRYSDVLAAGDGRPGWADRVVPGAPVIRAQLWYAVRHEMARSVDDLLERRTELGPRRLVDDRARQAACSALRA